MAWAAAPNEQLDDLGARVEYAFYADDQAALRQALEALEKLTLDGGERDAWQSELGFARWKLAQVQARTDHEAAAKTAQSCVDAIAESAGAEQQAFAAGCLAMLEELRSLRSFFYRGAREERLRRAQALNKRSPRVQFVAAWILTRREPESAACYDALKAALTAFDAGSELGDRGHAEALYLLGQIELARHDTLAARNALEQALVLAPDYRAAQELLRKVTPGGR